MITSSLPPQLIFVMEIMFLLYFRFFVKMFMHFGCDLRVFQTMCSFRVFVVYRPRGASRTSRVALLGAGAHALDAAAAVRGGPGPTSRGAAMTSAP